MRGRAAAGLLLPLLTLSVALWRGRPAPTAPLAPVEGGLVVALVRGETLERVRQALPGAALGVLPLRGADPDSLAAGSRSPAPEGMRLGATLRAAGVSTGASGRDAARLLDAPETGQGRCLALAGADLRRLRAEAAVLVVSLAGAGRLGPVALWRAGEDRSGWLLTSPSTRSQPGLIAPADVAATVAALCGVTDARIGAGRPARLVRNPGAGYLEGRVALWGAQGRAQRLLAGVPWALAAALAAGALGRSRALLAFAAAAPLALTLAGGLVGRVPAEGVYLVAAALAGGVGWSLRRQTPEQALRAIGWASVAAFLVDTLAGGVLLGRSPLSYSVLEAARFYGVGNEAAGAWLGAALAASSAGAAAAGLLLASAIGLGAPALGADAGGGLAALVGAGARLLERLPAGRRGRVGLLAAALVLALGGATIWWDGARDASRRSHLGEMAATVQRRGVGALGEVIGRKAAMNVRLAARSPWAALLATAAALTWRRRRHGGRLDAAALATGGTALALNDSGVVAAATLLLLLAPTLGDGEERANGPAPSGTDTGPQAMSGGT